MSSSDHASARSRAIWEERSATRVLETGPSKVLERSRRLVQAARQIIAQGGFEALTLRAVLDRARLSRRAFYERFEGKDDLILAVFEQTLRSAADEFRKEFAKVDDPLERLRFIIETMVLGAESDAAIRGSVAMSREHLRLAEARPHELQQALEPITSIIAEQLALGIERGVVREADPRELAGLVQHLVSATIHASLLSGVGNDGREERGSRSATLLWEFCLRAVRADG